MGIHMKNNINYTGATSLNTLRDVVINSPATGQGIVWDEEKQQWTNGEVSTNDMVEITLAEYEALSTEEKNNDTTYFITDADNTDPGGVGTAGILKPWLYDSDEEVVIGIYDGKPLYRKVYYIENQVISSSEIVINIDISSEIEKCVKVSSSIYDSLNSAWMLLPFRHPSYPIDLYVDGGSAVHLIFSNAYSPYDRITKIYITIEYTKTTDTEDSGVNLMPYTYVQNTSNNYSTEEQIVGKWIDGKPIYEKVIELDIVIQDTSRWADTYVDLGEIDIFIKGTVLDIYNQSFPVAMGWISEPKNIAVLINPSAINCEIKYLIIQYTKTTD